MPLDNETPKVRNTPQARPEVAAEKDVVIAAHEQAEKDMDQDPDLKPAPDPAADLDEGELARFENNDNTDLTQP